MPGDIVLGIKLKGDGSGLVGAVKLSRAELDKLEKETGQAGAAARKAANDTGRYSKQLDIAAQRARELSNNTRELERRKRALSATAGTLRVGIGALAGAAGFAGLAVGAVALGREILSTASRFEQLRLQLETVSGSAELAQVQFDQIKEFARSTPFEVDNLVAAFTRLQAAGITPTTDLMEAFGNTAAAFGRDITEFSDAVIGAVTGETERLKSFGIVARIEGEKMALNFRGRTVEVDRNAQAITAALAEIGRTEFAGGMERQTHSLAGALSNAQDAVSALFDEIGRAGVVDTATESVTLFTKAVEGLRRVAFPTLNEQLTDAENTIKRIQETTRFPSGIARGAASGQSQKALVTRSDLLKRLDFQRRHEFDPATIAANDRQAEAGRAAQEEQERRQAAIFAKNRERALSHLGALYEDRLQAQNREAELIDLHRQQEIDKLNQLHEAKLISEQEYNEAVFDITQTALEQRAELQRQAQEDQEREQQAMFGRLRSNTGVNADVLQKLWATGLKGQVAVASWGFGQLATLQEAKSRKMFAVGKAAAIAQATVDTIQGAQAAYANFAKFPPLAAAMAALALAAGYGRVQAIKNTQFGGGSAAGAAAAGAPSIGDSAGPPQPSISAAPPPAPVQQRAQPERRVHIHLTGEGYFTYGEVRDKLIPLLNDVMGDGASITTDRGAYRGTGTL